jgi:N-acetylneuraminic acid mutarotase
LYVFGGEFFEDGGGVFSDSWEYDPVLDSWQKMPSMKTPRHGTEAVTINDTIYIIGGANRVAFAAVGTTEGFLVAK